MKKIIFLTITFFVIQSILSYQTFSGPAAGRKETAINSDSTIQLHVIILDSKDEQPVYRAGVAIWLRDAQGVPVKEYMSNTTDVDGIAYFTENIFSAIPLEIVNQYNIAVKVTREGFEDKVSDIPKELRVPAKEPRLYTVWLKPIERTSESGWQPQINIDPDSKKGSTVDKYTLNFISSDNINISAPDDWKFNIVLSFPEVVEDNREFEFSLSGTATSVKQNDCILRIGINWQGLYILEQSKPSSDITLGKSGINTYTKDNITYKCKTPPNARFIDVSLQITSVSGDFIKLVDWKWVKKK